MLMADTVMDADEPRFQIGEDEMDDRQIVLGNLWVAALGNGKVFIPALAEAGISTPIVSDGQRPRSNGALHEPTKRVGAPIGYYGEPDTPGIASVLSLVLRGSRFPMTNLDGTSDENLVVDTPAFAASPSTNPCLVYLNMFPRLAADTILIGPHHASAELVENAEGRLIARQAKLSLKLNRRDAGRLAGDQISRPKPCAQRHMAAFHDGANRQARIVAALATAQDTGTSGDAEGIACGMAMRTDEAVAPSSFFHVGSTLRFIGKKLLKLWKRPRKGQVVTLKDVHGSLSIIHTKSIPSGCVRQADRQGVFFKQGKKNLALQEIWDHLPRNENGETPIKGVVINGNDLLPENRDYYRLVGSLTTPPCSENVQWHVFKEPIEASASQITAFTAIVAQNARPVQPLNNRLLIDSGKAAVGGPTASASAKSH